MSGTGLRALYTFLSLLILAFIMYGGYCYFYLLDDATETQMNSATTCPVAVTMLVGGRTRIKILASLNPKFFLHCTGLLGKI